MNTTTGTETTATETTTVRYSELECPTCYRTIYWCNGH